MDSSHLSEPEPPPAVPPRFTWGVAAASYQIEGAWREDGKGLSIWDEYVQQAGRIFEGHTGDVACDHYHRYAEDVRLMAEIGVQAYRFSISWPRVLPSGTGAPNERGLAFYDRLIDSLLERKIEPWVTLFHWDYPLALYQQGGWLTPASPGWFADYTALVVDRFSDRVTHWITLNEPQCFLHLGHFSRNGHQHAPGLQLRRSEVLQAAHHVLLAHGLAVQTIRSRARRTATIGWAPVGVVSYPATNFPEDIEAARRATMSVSPTDLWNNTWYADPVVLGHYPEEGLAAYGSAVPKIGPHDMETIRQPLDFYGANIYSGTAVQAELKTAPPQVPFVPEHGHSHTLRNVAPEALYWGPRFLAERYRLPIVITENGMSNSDWVSRDGAVHDESRIDLLRRCLGAMRRAIADGVDIRGYFHWSILDNFEWTEGYKHRFGLVHVDFQTQERTLKDSAHWYREVIASNGGTL